MKISVQIRLIRVIRVLHFSKNTLPTYLILFGYLYQVNSTVTNGFIWLAALVLLLIACSGNKTAIIIEDKFGMAYNPVRQKIPLVLVDAAMKFREDIPGERYIFVNKSEEGIKSPAYLRKILTIGNKQDLTRETDYFINPQEKLYLIFDHDYTSNQTAISVQAINEENFSNPSTDIQLPEADSILQAWGMKK